MKDFLKVKMGFNEAQIEEIVKSAGLKSAKSLENKLVFLCEEYKLSPIILQKMLQRTTVALTYSPEAINEKFDFFMQNYGFSKFEFGRLIARQPQILTYSVQTVQTKMDAYMKQLYLSPKDAKRLLLAYPSLLGYSTTPNLKKISFLMKIGVPNKAILKKPVLLSLPAHKISERMAICECLGLNKRKFVASGCLMVDEKRLYARAYVQQEPDYPLLASSKAEYKKSTGVDEKLLMELCEYIPELKSYYSSYYAKKGLDIDKPLASREKVEKLAEKEAE